MKKLKTINGNEFINNEYELVAFRKIMYEFEHRQFDFQQYEEAIIDENGYLYAKISDDYAYNYNENISSFSSFLKNDFQSRDGWYWINCFKLSEEELINKLKQFSKMKSFCND